LESQVIVEKKQTVWKEKAVFNFILGGSGAGYYLSYVLISFFLKKDPVQYLIFQPEWLSVILVTGGLLSVALEAGRPYRVFYIFNRLNSSWVSREVFLGVLFIIMCLMQWLTPNLALKLLCSVLAVGFLLCQGFILYSSRAVESWNSIMVPPIFLISGFYAGCGLNIINYWALESIRQNFMVFGFFAGIANFVLWLIYFRSTSLNKSLNSDFPSFYKLKPESMFLLKHIIPIGIICLQILMANTTDLFFFSSLMSIAAGVGILIITSLQKFRIILEMGNIRGIKF
jgi:DMSO reductase anchor subunit